VRKIETPYSASISPEQAVVNFLSERDALACGNLAKLSGAAISRRYTGMVDRFVGELLVLLRLREWLKNTNTGGRIAFLAMGSYGARELCLASDIDLMILHEGVLPTKIERALLGLLYHLWDAKLEVGYTIVTPEEAQRLMAEDFGTLTSILNSRMLLGSRAFHMTFKERVLSTLANDLGGMLGKILVEKAKREERFGGEEYFIEPDLKEGPGGLRDFHYMRWISKVCFGCQRFSDVKRLNAFTHLEINKLAYSRGFLLKVRNLLHASSSTKEDRLLVSHQERLSKELEYPDGPSISAPSRFMKDVYLHMNRIRYITEEFLTKAKDLVSPSLPDPLPPEFPKEFDIVKGNLVMKGGISFSDDLMLILKAFKTANKYGLFLGSGFIWEARKKITKDRCRLVMLPGAKEMFLDLILDPRNPRILRLALEIGLIDAFVPEFRKIRNLAQFGYYHVETVDLHSLRAMQVLHRIRTGKYDGEWPLLRRVWEELRHPEWLFLAALLHDIGKAYGKDHCARGARKIPSLLERLGLGEEAARTITFLVRHHILLARVSQRRDLGDEKTVVSVAQTVRDPELLRMLFLLTVADSKATGPMARSGWKALLLEEIFLKVNKILEGGKLAAPDTRKVVAQKRREVRETLKGEFKANDLEGFFGQVSTRYLLEVPVHDIIHHFRLALTMGDKPYDWVLKKVPGVPVTRIIECIYDRPGLFAKMVGVFTVNNLRVLSSSLFTLKNGLAFNIYEVTSPVDSLMEEDRWDRVRKEVMLALEDRLSLEELMAQRRKGLLRTRVLPLRHETKVKVDNQASDFFTIVEVIALYRPGVLYEVAKIIHSMGLDIRFAKVNTDDEKMMGSFYVRDKEGQKICERERLARLEQELGTAP